MVLVDHVVPGFERLKVDGVLPARGHPAHVARRRAAPARDVRRGVERQALAFHREARGDGRRGHVAHAGFELGKVLRECRGDPSLLELFAHAAAQARPFDGERQAPPLPGLLGDVGDRLVDFPHEFLRFGGVGLGASLAVEEAGERPPSHSALVRRLARLVEIGEGSPVDVDGHGSARSRRTPGRGEKLLRGRNEGIGALGDSFRLDEHDPSSLRDRGNHRNHVDEHGRERLHPLGRDALRDLVEHVDGAGELRDEFAGAGADVGGQKDLPARGRVHFVPRFERSLVGNGEDADFFDVVAEKLNARGPGVGGRKDVDEASANGELSPAFYHVDAGVCRVDECAFEGFEIDDVAHPDPHGLELAQPLRNRLQERANGHDEHAKGGEVLGMGEPALGEYSTRHRVGTRRQPLVRERFPGGKELHRFFGKIGAKRADQFVGLAASRRDGDDEGRLCVASSGVRPVRTFGGVRVPRAVRTSHECENRRDKAAGHR